MEKIDSELINVLDNDRVFFNELMSKHTSFKIGGPADIFVIVNTIEELNVTLSIAKQYNMPLTYIGNGTNVLVKDGGIRGIVIKLNLKNIEVKGEKIQAECGASLPIVSQIALENSLTGLEFACGIPGTIGGAVKMNAGAYGGEFKDIVESTTYLDSNMQLQTITNEEHKFDYRYSIFQDNDNIIISTLLKLNKAIKEDIKNKMDENTVNRRKKQPISFPNAGSIFKRKNSLFPAELIDKCELKGYNINGAYISEKHAGFIENRGNATARDVIDLIEHIKKTIREKYNTELELEIKILGED